MDGAEENELARLMRAAIGGDERAYAEFLRRAAVPRARLRPEKDRAGRDRPGGYRAGNAACDTPEAPYVAGRRARAAVALRDRALQAHRRLSPSRAPGGDRDRRDRRNLRSSRNRKPSATGRFDRALATLAPGQRSVVAAVSVDGRSISETAREPRHQRGGGAGCAASRPDGDRQAVWAELDGYRRAHQGRSQRTHDGRQRRFHPCGGARPALPSRLPRPSSLRRSVRDPTLRPLPKRRAFSSNS